MTRLPKRVRIGHLDFDIELCPWDSIDKGRNRGHISVTHRKIKVEDGSRPIIADGLLHEILHGIFMTHGLDEDKVLARREEQLMIGFTTGLLQIIRDNPKLIRYLLESAQD